MRRMSRFLLLSTAVVTGPSAIAAPKSGLPAVVGGVLACRNTPAEAERLACFDKASAALSDAVAQHDVTVLDKEEVKRTRKSLFGFQLPNLALLGIGSKGEESAPEAMVLDSTIRSVRSVSYGKYDMELEEHAVWRNIDLLDIAPRPGDKVHIKKAMLGSYFFKINSDRAIKAERIR